VGKDQPFTHTGPSGDNSATSPVTSDKGGLLGIMGDGGPRRLWAERRHQSTVPRGGRIIRRWLGGVAPPLSQTFAGRGLFILVSASDLFKAARFFHKVRRRNMTAVVYAHKAGRGNGVGLHYSRFRPAWRFIILPNQRLGLMPPSQNRHFPPRIREVGLARSSSRPEDFGSDFRPPSGSGRLVLRVSNWTWFSRLSNSHHLQERSKAPSYL
jgi:hypothetical protein